MKMGSAVFAGFSRLLQLLLYEQNKDQNYQPGYKICVEEFVRVPEDPALLYSATFEG